MKDIINNEVIDTYIDHPTHLVYRNDCSECFKKAPQVEINQDGDIVLVDNDLENDDVLNEVDTEICKNCKTICSDIYCDKCQYELEQDPNYFD